MRALRYALPLALALGAGLYVLLRPREISLDDPTPAPPVDAPADAKPRPVLTTGTLVVRVKTSDGSELPKETVAGYVIGRDRHVRPVSPDGVVRFSDVRLYGPGQTSVEAVAEAPGYFAASKEQQISPGIPAEALLTLTPSP